MHEFNILIIDFFSVQCGDQLNSVIVLTLAYVWLGCFLEVNEGM